MTDQPMFDPEFGALDRRLRTLDSDALFPSTPNLSASVARRLGSEHDHSPVTNLSKHRPMARRWWLVAAAAAVLALTSLLVAPQTRTTVGGWLGLDGVRIISRDQVTQTPVGGALALGEPTELGVARLDLSFTPVAPAIDTLGEPDEVYVSTGPVGGMLALIYHPDDYLPESGTTGTGLLLTAFRGDLNPNFASKGLSRGTLVEELEVAGERAIWIEGEAHLFFYTDPTGAMLNEELRLAGNTLLWQSGELTLRLEGDLPRDEMLRIAESVAPIE